MTTIFLWAACAVAASAVAASRGTNTALWFFMGLALGPLGLVLSFTSGTGRGCPVCKRGIHPKATKCQHCQTPLYAPENG
jgi:hypothetical protein